jgi:hypothetical protein
MPSFTSPVNLCMGFYRHRIESTVNTSGSFDGSTRKAVTVPDHVEREEGSKTYSCGRPSGVIGNQMALSSPQTELAVPRSGEVPPLPAGDYSPVILSPRSTDKLL